MRKTLAFVGIVLFSGCAGPSHDTDIFGRPMGAQRYVPPPAPKEPEKTIYTMSDEELASVRKRLAAKIEYRERMDAVDPLDLGEDELGDFMREGLKNMDAEIARRKAAREEEEGAEGEEGTESEEGEETTSSSTPTESE